MTIPGPALALSPSSQVAVGVDLVDVASLQGRLEGRDDLLGELFTRQELAYCLEQRRPWPHLAARFAAKEAALKALRSGLAGAMRWQDVEVTRDEAGTPGLALHGATANAFADLALDRATVSLAHTPTHAIAVVLLCAA